MAKPTKRVGINANRKAAERRKQQLKVLWKLVVVVGVIAFGYWLYIDIFPRAAGGIAGAIMPRIAINGIDVRGAEGLDSARLAKYLHLDTNANLFNVSRKKIEANIAKIPGVESVQVRKNPFSQAVSVRINRRVAVYQVNVGNRLHWADKNGYLWQGKKNSDARTPLVFGVRTIEDSTGLRIECSDFARLNRTFARIRGSGRNADNIKTMQFFENDVVKFTASNISVPVRMNGTLRYGSDDFEYFERVLRSKNRTPVRYLDAYENSIYSM